MRSQPPVCDTWVGGKVARGLLGLCFAATAVAAPAWATDTVETPCAACRLWDAAMATIPEDAVTIQGEAAPNGVVLRVTSPDLRVSQSLWTACTQRQRLLEALHRGETAPLCPDCQANLQAFDSLRIDLLRLPDGVLLLYTSAEAEVVTRLHTLVTGTTLPL